MTQKELIARINDLEWEDFEVKAAKASVPKSCWETVSAFSNTAGGWLVFGVRQIGKSFEIQGLDNPEKIEQDFLNTLRGEKFNVFVDTRQERYSIDGKVLLAFYIPVSKEKLVYFNTQANNYIRRYSSDQKARKGEIDSFYRDRSYDTKTSEAIVGTSIDDLDAKSVADYRSYMTRANPEASYNRVSDAVFYKKLRILVEDNCTYSGLLFLGKRDSIENHFPDFKIDLLEIPGTSYKDASSRYTFRLGEFENLWEYYFECFTRLRPKINVEYKVNSQGIGEEYAPGVVAMREALVNMLMHADYFSPASPRIRIFTDHLEFYNPGGLPKSLEELKGKDLSIPRSPVITKLFRMVGFAENAGFGFDKIDDNWKEYCDLQTVYETSFDSVIVKLPLPVTNPVKNEGRSATLEDIQFDFLTAEAPEAQRAIFQANLDMLYRILSVDYGINTEQMRNKNNEERDLDICAIILLSPNITGRTMAKLLDVSESTIEKDIAKLKKFKIVKRSGSNKTGVWKLMHT